MEGLFDYSLWGLFLASFLAATVVPFSSEALLSYLIINGTDPYTAVLEKPEVGCSSGFFSRARYSRHLVLVVPTEINLRPSAL